MKKNIENSDMPISRPTMSAPRSVRRRKIENGSSGWRVRSSITTNAREQGGRRRRAATAWRSIPSRR